MFMPVYQHLTYNNPETLTNNNKLTFSWTNLEIIINLQQNHTSLFIINLN